MEFYDDDSDWEFLPELLSRPRNSPMWESSTPRTRESSTAPKVNVPVQGVGLKPGNVSFRGVRSKSSKSPSRTASALKIQKVYRGVLVRRSVNKLIAIDKGVCEIQRGIENGEMLELIARNKKEGLRVGELLMKLILELDSVHGVNSSVRDCRKSVANRAIGLQEIVDTAVLSVDRNKTLESNATDTPNSVETGDDLRTRHIEKEKGKSREGGEIEVDKNEITNELLQKIMEDNRKMMTLISGTHEMQMKLLSSLSQRVQKLETSIKKT